MWSLDGPYGNYLYILTQYTVKLACSKKDLDASKPPDL